MAAWRICQRDMGGSCRGSSSSSKLLSMVLRSSCSLSRTMEISSVLRRTTRVVTVSCLSLRCISAEAINATCSIQHMPTSREGTYCYHHLRRLIVSGSSIGQTLRDIMSIRRFRWFEMKERSPNLQIDVILSISGGRRSMMALLYVHGITVAC